MDSYVEEGFSPVVGKEQRSRRRLHLVAGMAAVVLGAVALGAVAFSDSALGAVSLQEEVSAPAASACVRVRTRACHRGAGQAPRRYVCAHASRPGATLALRGAAARVEWRTTRVPGAGLPRAGQCVRSALGRRLTASIDTGRG